MKPKKFSRTAYGAMSAAVLAMTLVASAKAGTEKVLYSFAAGNDGSVPDASVVLKGGSLYGTTYYGGPYGGPSGCGTVFKLKPSNSGWKETVLYSFAGFPTDGCNPYSNRVIFDKLGNIYGETYAGGPDNVGTVYELQHTQSGWAETVLHSFTGGSDGAWPFGGLVFDRAGNIYGTTSAAGGSSFSGTIFKLTPSGNGWTEQVVYTFGGPPNDGFGPLGQLILDGVGNLYGTTYQGGSGACGHGCGTVFTFTPGGVESVLYNLQGAPGDGSNPQAGLLLHAGHFFSTTFSGGIPGTCSTGCGVVYELTHSKTNGWVETVLHQFVGGSDGNSPFSTLIIDKAGNLYGTTAGGGGSQACTVDLAPGCGTVFQLTPTGNGWTEGILYSFSGGGDGAQPGYGSLALDKAGNLYGTTIYGGAYGHGTVFEITP